MSKRSVIALIALSLFFSVSCHSKKSPDTSYSGPTSNSLPPPITDLRTVYFDFDKSLVREDQVDVLLSNSSVMKSKPNMYVTVEGHCDERGTNEYNLALGDRRARATRDYLINLGIDPNRMKIISYGEERPVCSEHDENCWWQNRRGVFVKQL